VENVKHLFVNENFVKTARRKEDHLKNQLGVQVHT
jgi:hypothetical protein